MNYLLDTNVVSELRKIGDGKADARVAAWVDTEDAESFFISAITILELERGVLGIQRRDAAQGQAGAQFARRCAGAGRGHMLRN